MFDGVTLKEEYNRVLLLRCNTLSGKGWCVKIEGEETNEKGESHAHQVFPSDPGE
jgi:hypothetical protein